MEEIDAVALSESVQTAAAVRVSPLHDEKLPKVTHDPPLARTPSSAHTNVLGPKAQRLLPTVTISDPCYFTTVARNKVP
ncbi:hypothetical protein WH47_12302 [Habropoda laboriosa]|uniref:Uncharacterized protein n=1 Tax=Habropoda laboriosa TaxID=597456 RepID=A0A0L7RAM9_9HYME|nr:hypothetical protein WH47_12302 [Habropoda laboriosa]